MIRKMKVALTAILACVLLSSCFTSAGERNAFELKARIAQIAMKSALRGMSGILHRPSDDFVRNKYWYKCLEKNNVTYKAENGIKTPYETLSDGYADCTNLALLSTWNYGYDAVTGWVIMEKKDSISMHIVIIYRGEFVVSSRATYTVDSVADFKNKFDDYYFFNFYTRDFSEEVSSSDVYDYYIIKE